MPKLTEQTQHARRAQILDAAERCFAQRGFHQTTIQHICREAGISPGALYIYFASKEALIAGICEREITEFSKSLAAIATAPDFLTAFRQHGEAHCIDEPADKARLLMEINAEAMRNPDIARIVADSMAFLQDRFTELLTEAKAKGHIEPVEDIRKIAQIIIMLGDGVYLKRAVEPDFDAKACMPLIMSMIGSLLRPVEPGQQIAEDQSAEDEDRKEGRNV